MIWALGYKVKIPPPQKCVIWNTGCLVTAVLFIHFYTEYNFQLLILLLGTPPELKTWFYQCIAYICVTIIEKLVVLMLFQFPFWKNVKKFILKPISGYPNVELVIVILIVPFIMNVSLCRSVICQQPYNRLVYLARCCYFECLINVPL